MPKDLTKYHPQACANCGHRDMHGEVAGCIAVTRTNPDAWCDCTTYVSPRDRAETARQGRQAAQEGMDAADASYAMTVNPDGAAWREAAQERLDVLIERGTDFTAEDVTDVVGVAPSPNAIGSLFRSAKGRMEAAGFTTATRAEAHGRALRVWRGKPA